MNLNRYFTSLLICLCVQFAVQGQQNQIVMQFLESPHTSGSVVRLADLVKVLEGNSPSLEKLMDMPLGPAPRLGTEQTWHSSDMLQHLELRGIHPASIRWYGKTIVELQRTEGFGEVQQSMVPAFVNQRVAQQASSNVAQALTEYLNYKNEKEPIDWVIDVEIPDKHVQVLQIRRNIESVGGGAEPWTGDQQFVLAVKNAGTPMSLPIRARVSLPPMIVTSRRSIRKEEVLTAEALTYASLPKRSAEDESRYFTRIEDLVGKQARRSISTGLPVSDEFVGDPIVIGRNELVEVESVAGGVVVRTTAKSLSDGAVGDLVEIELNKKERLHAVVVRQALVRITAVPSRVQSRR
jgi:flagellar basal body P-ring formation protein FlgA